MIWFLVRQAGRSRFYRRIAVRAGLLCMILLAVFNVALWPQAIAIRNVTVIDATGRAAQTGMTVIVDQGRIAAVGPSRKTRIPRNAQIVDGTGKFLIPGLWDMHVHGASDDRAPWSHLLFIANGVVGVREMSGPPDARAWRASQASNADPSPTVYLGSPIVDGPHPTWPDSIVVADAAQGRAAVDEQQQRGADFIKVYSRLPRDAYFAIADEAKKRGIPFEGHVPDLVTAAEASNAGQKSIEHLTGVANACSKDEDGNMAEIERLEALFRAPSAGVPEKVEAGKGIMRTYMRIVETYDAPTAQAIFARFVKNGTWQCPTLTLLQAQIDERLPASDPRLKYLSPKVRAHWEAGYYPGFPPPAHTAMTDVARAQFGESMKITGQMYRAGVSLLAGTDAMNPNCFPGFSIHDELALLVEAGLPPLSALQTATRNAAEFMGQLDRRGTIEAGKAADLVLLDKDPLVDIHNTRSVQAVVLNGKLFSRGALDAMLAKAETLANRPESSGDGKMN